MPVPLASEYNRAKLVAPKGSPKGRMVYLPQDVLEAAWGSSLPPDDLYASRVVLHRGKKQILVRLYDGP